ncbi:hypothetical protein GGR17_002337 [Confluentimicrobium naphthalenivorans]|uniref:Uncharacterized protein n=1 Tax=Actibacterium naphthalenivorans TaxID=1614693 RepID=A0A840CG97_9RHOB|nr:hypothetical protein [Actibacterium naphthalenivorans]
MARGRIRGVIVEKEENPWPAVIAVAIILVIIVAVIG